MIINYKVLSKGNWMIILLALTLFALPQKTTSDSGPAHVFIVPAESTALRNETHQIAVMIDNVFDLTAYHLVISFDPKVVSVLEVVNGDFLAEPEDVDYFYEPSNGIDNVNGLITFGMAQQGVEVNPEVEPQSGSGSLVVITLQAIKPSSSTTFSIDAEKSSLVEWPSVFPIDFTVADGVVKTESCFIYYYFPLFTR